MNALAEEARTYLDSWVAVLNNQEIQAETFVEFGSIVKNILWAAERENADLIAMSSHGRTGLPRVLYGSVAAGILHQTRLPLLLIRSEDAPET